MKVGSRLMKGITVAGSTVILVGMLGGYSFAQDAKQIYAEKCEACHGATGKGDGPAGKVLTPPPSDFAVSLKGKSDDWIAKAIKGGGPAVGESAVMPGYGDLSDQQVKELVDYIKAFRS